MSDLRNKIRKEIEREQTRAMQRRLDAGRPKLKPAKCLCGNTHLETHLWAWSGDRNVPAGVYCPGCLPYALLSLVIGDAVNLPA